MGAALIALGSPSELIATLGGEHVVEFALTHGEQKDLTHGRVRRITRRHGGSQGSGGNRPHRNRTPRCVAGASTENCSLKDKPWLGSRRGTRAWRMYSFGSLEDTCVMKKHYPLKELLLTRLREFVREPSAIFWVYGFPILLALGLGIAFRNRPVDRFFVDVQEHPGAPALAETLRRHPEFTVEIHSPEECMKRLRLGKSSIVVVPGPSLTFLFDPTRPESALARRQVDDALQQSAGRQNPVATRDQPVTEPGARYIDFLVPGLLGMNLMGGGLWGVGFLIVDMRVKKLLKRLMATPMKKAHLLGSMIGGRLVFMIPEVVIILGAGALLFNVAITRLLGSDLLLFPCLEPSPSPPSACWSPAAPSDWKPYPD